MIRSEQNWARETAASSDAAISDRRDALRLLSYGAFADARASLAAGLTVAAGKEIQVAAVDAVTQFNDPEIALLLMDAWPNLVPEAAQAAISKLLAQVETSHRLLDAIGSGRIPPTGLTASHRQALREHAEEGLRDRAEELFGKLASREDVIARYLPAASGQGDVENGRGVFAKHCATCHRYGALGNDVGPNLATTDYHTPETLLVQILDPNRDVNPAFQQYLVVDHAGRSYNGIIASQTAASMTLRDAEGKEVEILSSDVENVTNLGRSLMPEGIEKSIAPKELSDLIQFILSIRYDRARTSTLPGWTEPPPQPAAAETPDADVSGLSSREQALVSMQTAVENHHTIEEWAKRRAELRRQFRYHAGLPEERSTQPPSAVVHSQRHRGDYSIANVTLETFPGFYLTGNLYRPLAATKSRPAILCPHGHFADGRYREGSADPLCPPGPHGGGRVVVQHGRLERLPAS